MNRRSIFYLLFVHTLVLVAACAPAVEAPAEPARPAPGSYVHTTADGVEMPYDVHGAGPSAVVLIHCWMCERGFWDAQIPVLEAEHLVVAMDLPGHGAAGTGRDEWSIARYGDDVAGLLDALDLDDVVLVGHSMGGPVALRAAALAPDRVRGIVAVDTLHDAEIDFDQPMSRQILEMFANDFRGSCNLMVSQMFVEEGVEDVVAEVRRVGCEESDESVGQALMQDFVRLDMPALFAEAGVPIRAINAASDNNPTRAEVNRKYADFRHVEMEGVGHYPHMTRPEAFNALLLEALADLDTPAGT